jgi:hypothetical protein
MSFRAPLQSHVIKHAFEAQPLTPSPSPRSTGVPEYRGEGSCTLFDSVLAPCATQTEEFVNPFIRQ